jgi:hypothetical protein
MRDVLREGLAEQTPGRLMLSVSDPGQRDSPQLLHYRHRQHTGRKPQAAPHPTKGLGYVTRLSASRGRRDCHCKDQTTTGPTLVEDD